MSLNKILDSDIRQIKNRIEELIEETKIQYVLSYEALRTNNYDLVLEAITNERNINSLQNDFTNVALWKLAKQQMVASDLRLTVGSILISREIEVIADYAKWTCKFFIKYKPSPKEITALTEMFELLIQMLDLVAKLTNNFDASQKNRLLELQNILNNKFKEFNLLLFNKAREVKDEKEARTLMAEIRQIANLERAGEHLVAIQEILNFIRTGKFEDISETLISQTI